jgi:hypothetical protein
LTLPLVRVGGVQGVDPGGPLVRHALRIHALKALIMKMTR